MRQRDLHILTSALHTYTNDWRISALHTTVRETRGSPRSFGNSSSTRQPVYESRDNMATSPWTKKNVTDVWDDDDAGVWSEWTLVKRKRKNNNDIYFYFYIVFTCMYKERERRIKKLFVQSAVLLEQRLLSFALCTHSHTYIDNKEKER